jgi:hypothetical protein
LSSGECGGAAQKRAATGAQRLRASVAVDFVREAHRDECVAKMAVFVDGSLIADARNNDTSSKTGTVRTLFFVDLLDGDHDIRAFLKKAKTCAVFNKAVIVELTSVADISPAQVQRRVSLESSSSSS